MGFCSTQGLATAGSCYLPWARSCKRNSRPPNPKRVVYGEGHPIGSLIGGPIEPGLRQQGGSCGTSYLKVTPFSPPVFHQCSHWQKPTRNKRRGIPRDAAQGSQPFGEQSRARWRANLRDIQHNKCLVGPM